MILDRRRIHKVDFVRRSRQPCIIVAAFVLQLLASGKLFRRSCVLLSALLMERYHRWLALVSHTHQRRCVRGFFERLGHYHTEMLPAMVDLIVLQRHTVLAGSARFAQVIGIWPELWRVFTR